MVREADVEGAALRSLAARLLPTDALDVERTADGVSSQMYRLGREGGVGGALYLRVGEDEEDLRADAEIHDRLRAAGVRVPEVVAVEALAPELGRSVLLMREIPGIALSGIADEGAARAAARGAGRDAAVMNATPVDGFGWIVRDGRRWPPKGETATYGAFAREGIPPEREHRERLLSGLFSAGELDALDEVVADAVPRPLERGSLSHGDLDVTAIHVHDGSYAGLIDFSELRGGEPEFDLGHFLLHDQETNPISLFADFLAGYREVAAADPDVDRVRRVAILVGLRQLCGSLGRGVPRSWFTRFRAAQLLNLLEGRPACAPR